MKPIEPVIPGKDLPVTRWAETQPEYQVLPSFKDSEGVVITRWRCSFWERLRILFIGDVYLQQLTFHQSLQPVLLQTEPPDVEEQSGKQIK